MRGRDKQRWQQLDAALHSFHVSKRALPGIQSATARQVFLEQLFESIHRVDYVRVIDGRDISPLRADPNSSLFDPIKAAVLHKRAGNIDEAYWLVFLSVHFGRHRTDGWRLARDIYGALGQGRWDWPRVSASPAAFRSWLGNNVQTLRSSNPRRRFSNHRKYESLDAYKPRGTGEAVASYVRWVNPPRNHAGLLADCQTAVGPSPGDMFDYLYESMSAVATFGRMAKFDYLTMVGKLRLAPIEPSSTYMDGATGPYRGGNLLFAGNTNAALHRANIDLSLRDLGAALQVGMQVLEDALCNWQKSPSVFVRFR